jgi:hypothetical protein
MEDGQESRPFLGSEPFLVGLSTGYWSNIPMSIADVHETKIVGGVICIIRHSPRIQFFPVSKCTLVGMIVFADFKADNKISYVLDDGTGWIDCLAWAENQDGIYALPTIAGFTGAAEKSKFAVGDRVRIFGSISCLNVSDTYCNMQLNGSLVEVRDCIHEIKVNSIERLASSETANDLNWEANHWVRSIQSTKPATGGNKCGLRNAIHTLEWLGPKIRKDVEKLENFPSSNDPLGAWKVFGVACTCKLSYKEALLYCHCKATAEPLDPEFEFRDMLLNHLLEMEQEHRQSQEKQNNPQLDLRFQYRTIANIPALCKTAKEVVSETEKPELNVAALIQGTFRALRQDGILCLLDEDSDTYLLVSRKGVLEPYIQRRAQRKKKWHRKPFYLRHVSDDRLKYVEKCSVEEGD